MLSHITNFASDVSNLQVNRTPMYLVLCLKSRSPEVSTRTRASTEMVEPVGISDYDVPFKQLGHQLGELVAVTTHPEVLGYP